MVKDTMGFEDCHTSLFPKFCLFCHVRIHVQLTSLCTLTKAMSGPNKGNVIVFVLGSSQGSQVMLSEVKVTEASLPSDSFYRGGHEGEQ